MNMSNIISNNKKLRKKKSQNTDFTIAQDAARTEAGVLSEPALSDLNLFKFK